MGRWLYRTALINLVVVICLALFVNLILWLSKEEKGESFALEKYYEWLTTYFPLVLLTLLYLIGCMVILIQGIKILVACQSRSALPLFASIHCLNIFLLYGVTSLFLLRPLFQKCQQRFYQ